MPFSVQLDAELCRRRMVFVAAALEGEGITSAGATKRVTYAQICLLTVVGKI